MTLFGQEHVKRYRETDGAEGHIWRNGSKILILTTTGRKSGEPRDTPLIYEDYDGAYVIVASKGGAPQHPAWFLNLEANQEAEVQVLADRFPVRARVAQGEERQRLWDLVNRQWPDYSEYQRKTGREIPVVVLERA